MGIGESHALSREAVKVGRFERRILTIARRLSVTNVVEQNKDDVGPWDYSPRISERIKK
jgi:hypothetical protein